MQRALRTGRAIGGKNGAIGALVKAGAELPFTLANEFSRLLRGKSGEVVDVFRTLAAEAGALVALHVLPAGSAWGGNAEIFRKRFGYVHHVFIQLDRVG